jgi:hypothetical protein
MVSHALNRSKLRFLFVRGAYILWITTVQAAKIGGAVDRHSHMTKDAEILERVIWQKAVPEGAFQLPLGWNLSRRV